MADAVQAFVMFEAAESTFGNFTKGESRHKDFPADKGWIECKGIDWTIAAETNFDEGGGASVGKPTTEALSFKHAYDLAGPQLQGYIAAGAHFKVVEFRVCKAVGTNTTVAYLIIRLDTAFCTEANLSLGADGKLEQEVKLVFKKIDIRYQMQTETGKLEGTASQLVWEVQGHEQVTVTGPV